MRGEPDPIARDQSKRLEELVPDHLSSPAGRGGGKRWSELAIYNGGGGGGSNLSFPTGAKRSAAENNSGGVVDDDDDDDDESKVSRRAFLDIPFQFKTEEGQLNFALPARMGVDSTMLLSPRWTGHLSSFAEVLSGGPDNSSGYTGGKVEVDYRLPSPSSSKDDDYLYYKRANVSVGLVSRGYHRLVVGGKVVRPFYGLLGSSSSSSSSSSSWYRDFTVSAQHAQWLNRPSNQNSGRTTTVTIHQKLAPACTLQTIGTLDTVAAPTLTISLNAAKTISPWNFQMGWRWYSKEQQQQQPRGFGDVNPFWSVSVTPKLSNLLWFHCHAGWNHTNGFTTTCLWKQNLQQQPPQQQQESQQHFNIKKKKKNKLGSSSSLSDKTFELGVQTNWMSKRMALIVVWTDHDFRLRIPIGLSSSSSSSSSSATTIVDSWWSFLLSSVPVQSFFCTILTRVIQDGLADILNLQQAQNIAQETAQQQRQLQQTKARGDAMKQQHLMKRQAESRLLEEGEMGLRIRQAIYGPSPPSNKNNNASRHPRTAAVGGDSHDDHHDDYHLDVTVALQFWVQQGQLELPFGSSKMNLLGFCDPRCSSSSSSSTTHKTTTTTTMPWWYAFVTPQDSSSSSSSSNRNPQGGGPPPSPPMELYIQYDCGGFTYEITLADEEGIVLPSPRATRIETPNVPIVRRG